MTVIRKKQSFQTDHLINFCESITDCHHSSPVYIDSGKIVIRNYNIKGGRLLLDDISYTDEETFKTRIARAIPKAGDLIITREAPMGEVCIIPDNIECCLGQRMVLIKPDYSKVDNNFLLYSLLSQYVQIQIKKSEGTGSIVSNLRIPTLKELNIPKRDLINQKNIGKVLSDLDAKIELNNKINAELEAMAKLIYDYWFVQFEFPNEAGKPYKSSGGKMVWNEEMRREIPEGWEVKEFGEMIELFDSQRVPLSSRERMHRKGNIPYYGATSIMDYIDDYIFDDEYILMAEDGSVMNEKGFPIVQFIFGKTWVNNHAHVIQAKKKSNNEFYFQQIKTIPVVLIKTGSIQMKINQENLKKHKVLTPSDNLISKYSEKANSIRKELINKIEQNQKLAELRDWLLPMLMNGQVRVGEAEALRSTAVTGYKDHEVEEFDGLIAAETETKYRKI